MVILHICDLYLNLLQFFSLRNMKNMTQINNNNISKNRENAFYPFYSTAVSRQFVSIFCAVKIIFKIRIAQDLALCFFGWFVLDLLNPFVDPGRSRDDLSRERIRTLVFAQRFLESPRDKHCNLFGGNIWRKVVRRPNKGFWWEVNAFRRSFIINGLR